MDSSNKIDSETDKKDETLKGPTLYLFFANLIMYVVTSIVGGSILLTGRTAIIIFGFNYYLFFHGFVWTPLTSIFAHGSIGHIGSNMIFLFIFGFKLEERGYGTKSIIYAYLLTGIASTLIGSIFLNLSTITLGASGAVFGILGVNIGLDRRENSPNYKKTLGFAVILFIFSGTSPNVNIFAHLIGLVIGYFVGKSDQFYFSNQMYTQLA